MTAATKKVIDWELVEKHYRTGAHSLRGICKIVDGSVTEAAIRKRALRDLWERDTPPNPATKNRGDRVVVTATDPLATSGFVYVVYVTNGVNRFYKIGLTKQFNLRLAAHQCSSPFEVCVACCYFVADMRQEERALHAAFSENRVRGEWFLLNEADLRAISQRVMLS